MAHVYYFFIQKHVLKTIGIKNSSFYLRDSDLFEYITLYILLYDMFSRNSYKSELVCKYG